MCCWPAKPGAFRPQLAHRPQPSPCSPLPRDPVTLPLDVALWATKGLPQDSSHLDSSHLPEWDDYITECKRIQSLTIFLSVYFHAASSRGEAGTDWLSYRAAASFTARGRFQLRGSRSPVPAPLSTEFEATLTGAIHDALIVTAPRVFAACGSTWCLIYV